MLNNLELETKKEFFKIVKDFECHTNKMLHLLEQVKRTLKGGETCFNILAIQDSVDTVNQYMNNMNRMYDRCELIEEMKFELECEVENVD